jgi:type I restriction enzyme S subunit
MRIDEIFRFEKGVLQSSKCVPGEFDFITASSEWKTHNEYTHDCEALIFAAAASGSLGRTHYVNGKFVSSDLCFIITPKDQENLPIDLKFYHILFNELKDEIVRNTKAGTSKEAIGLGSFGKYELPYFDIDTQIEIKNRFVNSEEIKSSLSTELNQQVNLVKKLRQQLLQDAVQGKLVEQNNKDQPASELLEKIKAEKRKLVSEKKIKKEKELPSIKPEEIPFEIPENWIWCRLGDSVILKRGKSKHRPRNDISLFEGGTYPFIQTGDVARSKTNGYLIETINGYYNDFGLSQSLMQNKGTLCITIAANIAECGFLGFDACAPDSIVCLNAIDKIIEKYCFYYIIQAREDIEKYAPATAQKNINLEILNSLLIPLPPLSEQNRIVQKLDELMQYCNELEESIKQSESQNEKLLQQVLREALRKEPVEV